jgi:carboxymethylenebutenolidase
LQPQSVQITPQTCPIVASFPENDFTTQDARDLESALQSHGVPHDIKLYPQTLHSFTNEYTAAYNAAASEDAWQRLVAFFAAHLLNQPSGEKSNE